MQNFFKISSKLLQGYKSILRKQLSREGYHTRLEQLQWGRSLPRQPVVMYQLLARIVEVTPIEEQKLNEEPSRLRYSGGGQFFRDLRELLAQYHADGDELIHASQEASSAMVTAIQLMVLPSVGRSMETATQLQDCVLKIARFGMKEQRQLLFNSLEKHLHQDKTFFLPILEHYQLYLEQYGKAGKKKISAQTQQLRIAATV